MILRTRTLTTFLILIPLLSSSVHSEDSKRGKLPDGRPFRTDLDGTQIVDYIADLENSVEYLKERVATLEIDLELSKATIEKLRDKRGQEFDLSEPRAIPEPKLFEKDLLVSDVSASSPKAPAPFKEKKLPPPKPVDPLAESRSLMMKEIGETNALLSKRKDLYKIYSENQSANPVSIKLTDPKTKKGRTISNITEAVKGAVTQKELFAAKSDLSQIKKSVSDDILLIKRLGKMS